MKTFFLVLFMLLAAVPGVHAENAKDSCQPNPDVPINITPVYEEPVYDYTTSLAGLQELSRDAAHIIPEALTLGLTHYQPVLSVNPVSIARDMPDGTTCVRVEKVDITFGYHNVIVYVANEIGQGTCGFEQVMTHEQKHVAVQKKILNDFIPVLQKNLKEYLAANGSMQNKSYPEAVTWLRDNVEAIAQDVVTKIYEENQHLQADIDTVEEYERVGNTCNGQLHDVVRSFMQAGQ